MDVTVLQSIDWEVLVVDEAHRLKNNQSKVGGKMKGEEGEGRECGSGEVFVLFCCLSAIVREASYDVD